MALRRMLWEWRLHIQRKILFKESPMFKYLSVVSMMVFGLNAFGEGTAPTASATKLTDGQISTVLSNINEGEIAAAKLAKSKATHKEVKEFADLMAKQHAENREENRNLTAKNKIRPQQSDLANSLKKDAENSNKNLKRTAKDQFDVAYVTGQVAMHEKALSTLDDILIPSAQDAELKKYLEQTRTAVNTHLEHAKELQTRFQ
jgi:putative membrane protein